MKCYTICSGNATIIEHISNCFNIQSETKVKNLIEKKSTEHVGLNKIY